MTGTTKSTGYFPYDFGRDTFITANFTPPISKLYFPHVASQQVGGSPADIWETEVCLINTGDQPLSGTLKSYQNNGRAASSQKTITLAAHGRWSRIVGGGEFTNPSEIGYMVFEAPSDSVVGYTKFYIPGNYRAAIPAVREVNASEIYITHIASADDWWTGISLVNTTSAEKALTITFNTGETGQITLAANGHEAFDVGTRYFNNQPRPDIQSAVISNAGGVIGLELFTDVDPAWGPQMEGIPLTNKTASTIYYPHVADDGFWTGIVAYNPSDLGCRITITPYDAQGSVLTTSTFDIEGREKYVGEVFSDLGLPDQTAWFRIDSPRPLSGFQLFGSDDGTQLAAYAAGGGTGAKAGVFPKIEKSGWTDIVFVNTDGAAASVTLTAYDDNGDVMAIQQHTLDSYAKMINSPDEIFLKDISGATYIAYSSDRNVVGFQLNGSGDGTMLDGLPALGGTH